MPTLDHFKTLMTKVSKICALECMFKVMANVMSKLKIFFSVDFWDGREQEKALGPNLVNMVDFATFRQFHNFGRRNLTGEREFSSASNVGVLL